MPNGTKGWIAGLAGTTSASTTVNKQQASVLASFPTTTAGTFNATTLNVGTLSASVAVSTVSLQMAGQVNLSVTANPVVVPADSTSAVASATLTGAANTIAGFIKITMNSTTGSVDRFIYTYGTSPTG